MPRPKRKRIGFDEKSLNDLYQEVYNDQFNLKAKLGILYRSWEAKAKTMEDINVIGAQILQIVNLEAKNHEQKLTILKILKEIIKDKKMEESSLKKVIGDVEEASKTSITQDDKNELLEFIERERSKNK